MQIEKNFKLGVEYTFVVHKAAPGTTDTPVPGTARVACADVPNLITNYGMDAIGATTNSSSNWGRGCQVGTGSSTPAVTDTALANRLASSVARQGATHTPYLSEAEPYIEETQTYRFAAGVAAGTLTEVALVWAIGDQSSGAMSPTAPIVSRALLPVAVVVLPDEILDVVAKRRTYIPVDDVPATVAATGGVITGSTNTVTRASEANKRPSANTGGWGSVSDSQTCGWDLSSRLGGGQGEWMWYAGAAALGSIVQAPAGTQVTGLAPTLTTAPYVGGNHYRDITVAWGLGTSSNPINSVAGGLKVMRWCLQQASFQTSFDPPIVKTHNDLLSVTMRVSWARK